MSLSSFFKENIYFISFDHFCLKSLKFVHFNKRNSITECRSSYIVRSRGIFTLTVSSFGNTDQIWSFLVIFYPISNYMKNRDRFNLMCFLTSYHKNMRKYMELKVNDHLLVSSILTCLIALSLLFTKWDHMFLNC